MMERNDETVVADDLTSEPAGEPAAETVQFAFEGESYELDASPETAERLRSAVAPYAESARPHPDADWHGSPGNRIRYLHRTIYPEGTKPYPSVQIARFIRDRGGEISSNYVNKVMTGERREPSHAYIKGMAEFFGLTLVDLVSENPPKLDRLALTTAITLRDPLAKSLVEGYEQLSEPLQAVLFNVMESLIVAHKRALPASHGDPVHNLLARWVLLTGRSQEALDLIVGNLLAEVTARTIR